MDMSFRKDPVWLGTHLQMVSDFVVVVDPEGIIPYVNKVEEEYRMEEVLGQPVREFRDPRVKNAFDAALQATLESGEDSAEEALVRTTGKAKGWYRNRMFPLRREGKTAGVMVLARNLAELTTTEQELDRIHRLLPVCAWCSRIRGKDGEWESIGDYLQREMETDLPHGLCPTCEGTWEGGSHPPE